MSVILAAVLVVTGLLGAIVTAVGIPVLIGTMAYDLFTRRGATTAKTHDAEERISLERGFARGFVIFGGVFWAVASFAGAATFRQTGLPFAATAAFIPLVATAATLIVGWYFERLTAALLVVASFAAVVWGVMAGFEAGVWLIVVVALIGPMMTAATLFWLARSEQEAFELRLAAQGSAELAPIAPTQGPQF
jgi:hypothetical protein